MRWRDNQGVQRKRDFTRKALAVSFDAEIRSRLDKGTSLDLAAGRQPLAVYARRHREGLSLRPSTMERLERVFRLHVDPLPLGGMPLSQIRPSHVRGWVKDRALILAPSTLAVTWGNLSAVFTAAVLDRVIGVSPCAGVRLPAAPRHARFVPSAAQVLAVISALPPRYRAAGWLAAGCGWRRGEILGLEASAIDFLRRTAAVTRQLTAGATGPAYLAPVKTPATRRVSELPGTVALALARHLEMFPPRPVPVLDATDPRKPVRREALLVFTTPAGRPVHPSSWARAWRRAADSAGVPAGVHCLRHYYGTLLIHEGADVKTVQAAMGHATPVVTLNTYAGEWPEGTTRTRQAVDTALGAGPDVPPACPGPRVKP